MLALQLPSPQSLEYRLGHTRPRSPLFRAIDEALAEHVHLDLTGNVLQESTHPRGLGGFCDVFRGLSLVHGFPVAIKRFRVHIHHDKTFAKSLARELRIWSKLHHPNVLPLLGYTIDDDVYPALISRWMMNGTSIQYLKNNPGTSVMTMVRGIAAGLCYLHSMGVAHSDLKSDNVLVSTSGTPLLADFGVSRIIIESKTIETKSSLRGSVRWMANELLDPMSNHDARKLPPERSRLQSAQADVWAFGMTVYELLTMLRPYHHLPSDFQVIFAIIRGQLPSLPETFITGITTAEQSALWYLCKKCWQRTPDSRPTMDDVCRELDGECLQSVKTQGCVEGLMTPLSHDVEPPFFARRRNFRQKCQMANALPKVPVHPKGDAALFAKRRREAYMQLSNNFLKAGLSEQAVHLKKEHRLCTAEQLAAILSLFYPTAPELPYAQSSKQTSLAKPITSLVDVAVASDSFGLLTGVSTRSPVASRTLLDQAKANHGTVTRRFSLGPSSSSWTLVHSMPDAEMSFVSSSPSPRDVMGLDISVQLRRTLGRYLPVMKVDGRDVNG